jgi:glycosyltransferase involved in cell wall biosynthesis
MESLSMGVPIITNDSRGCRDVVKDGINGVVLKENNVESIAEVMKQLAENIVLRKSLSKQAHDDRKQYDRQKYIQYQINYYKKLVERF